MNVCETHNIYIINQALWIHRMEITVSQSIIPGNFSLSTLLPIFIYNRNEKKNSMKAHYLILGGYPFLKLYIYWWLMTP